MTRCRAAMWFCVLVAMAMTTACSDPQAKGATTSLSFPGNGPLVKNGASTVRAAIVFPKETDVHDIDATVNKLGAIAMDHLDRGYAVGVARDSSGRVVYIVSQRPLDNATRTEVHAILRRAPAQPSETVGL